MNFYWPKRDYLSYSGGYAAVTYDPPTSFQGSSIRVPLPGPSSCVWIVPGTEYA